MDGVKQAQEAGTKAIREAEVRHGEELAALEKRHQFEVQGAREDLSKQIADERLRGESARGAALKDAAEEQSRLRGEVALLRKQHGEEKL